MTTAKIYSAIYRNTTWVLLPSRDGFRWGFDTAGRERVFDIYTPFTDLTLLTLATPEDVVIKGVTLEKVAHLFADLTNRAGWAISEKLGDDANLLWRLRDQLLAQLSQEVKKERCCDSGNFGSTHTCFQEVKEEGSRLPCGCLWDHTSNSVIKRILNCPVHLPEYSEARKSPTPSTTQSAKVGKKSAFGKGQTKANALKRRLRSEITALRTEIERLQSPIYDKSLKDYLDDNYSSAKAEMTPAYVFGSQGEPVETISLLTNIADLHWFFDEVNFAMAEDKDTHNWKIRDYVEALRKQIRPLPMPEPTGFETLVYAQEKGFYTVKKWQKSIVDLKWHTDDDDSCDWFDLVNPKVVK